MSSTIVKSYYAKQVYERNALSSSMMALSEFYSEKADKINIFLSGLDEFSTDSLSLIDGEGYAITVTKAQLTAALNDDDQLNKDYAVTRLATTESINVSAADIINVVTDNTRSTALNAAYFSELSTAAVTGGIDSNRFVNDLKTTFGDVLPEGTNSLVKHLSSGASVSDIVMSLSAIATSQRSVDISTAAFDTTSYYGTNLFTSALISLGEDIAAMWNAAVSKYDTVVDILSNLGDVLVQAGTKLFTYLFPDVINNWELDEKVESGFIGIPILTLSLSTVADGLDSFFEKLYPILLPGNTDVEMVELYKHPRAPLYSYNGTAAKWYYTRDNSPFAKDNMDLTGDTIKAWLIDKLSTTGIIEIPTKTMTIRIFATNNIAYATSNEYMIEVYPLNTQMTSVFGADTDYKVPVLFPTWDEQVVTRMSGTPNDENAFYATERAFYACFAEVASWPVYTDVPIMTNDATTDDIAQILSAQFASCGFANCKTVAPFSSYDPNGIVSKLCATNTAQAPYYYSMYEPFSMSESAEIMSARLASRPALLAFLRFILLQLILASGDQSIYRFSEDISKVDSLGPISLACTEGDMEDVLEYTDGSTNWVPYSTEKFLSEQCHPQTTAERVSEVKTLIIRIIIAAAAVTATVAFIKVKKKLRTALRTQDQVTYNAYDAVSQIDPKANPAAYKAALKTAAKAEKKATRLSRFSSLIGGTSSNYYSGSVASPATSDSSDAIIDLLI